MKKTAAVCAAMLCLSASAAFCGGKSEGPVSAGMVVSDPSSRMQDGKTIVSVEMLTGGARKTVSTASFDPANEAAVKAALAKGNLVDFRMAGGSVLVPEQAAKTFHKVLSKHGIKDPMFKPKPGQILTQFDTMKYGPELSPADGKAGRMVAAGWVYGKTADAITVGDGRIVGEDISGRPLPAVSKRYEETYRVAKDVAVYRVDVADYAKSAVSDFASIPVTKDYDYRTTERQAVYVVFDRDFSQADKAKVSEIYYFTPMSVSDGLPVWDVQTLSSLLKDRGADPASGKPYVEIRATSVAEAPYTRSTEPFAIVKDRFYYVGDNEVAVYLFAAGDRLIMLDAGWPNSGYQYWKNIEATGHDPRKVTDIMLTHGHGDHYGTAMELVEMIENAGGKVKIWGTKEDAFGIQKDAMGNAWNIKGALPESQKEIRERTVAYEYDKEMDFGDVRILATPTPGHTPGTASFIFKVKNPAKGDWVSFCYMGGYGFNGLYKPTDENGWLRLSFQLGLAWLQQTVDTDYVAPQHTNQFPFVDIYQAVKARNNDPANAGRPIDFLDALTKGEVVNFLEKRYSVATNLASDINDSRYRSIETSGPYKPGREFGASGVKATLLDGGKIIQGFSGVFNATPNVPLLRDGILNNTDVYTADPAGWYAQFYIDVLDDYAGFIPGGPVESMRPTPGTPEILRTQRLGSRAEAETILASVRKGGTYRISLTQASAIFVPADASQTFRQAE